MQSSVVPPHGPGKLVCQLLAVITTSSHSNVFFAPCETNIFTIDRLSTMTSIGGVPQSPIHLRPKGCSKSHQRRAAPRRKSNMKKKTPHDVESSLLKRKLCSCNVAVLWTSHIICMRRPSSDAVRKQTELAWAVATTRICAGCSESNA